MIGAMSGWKRGFVVDIVAMLLVCGCAEGDFRGPDSSVGGGQADGGGERIDAAVSCGGEICSDDDACTADSCGAADECVYEPITCSDGDSCTTDSCDTATGCVFEPVAVSGDACPSAAIDVSAGGSYTGDTSCAGDDSASACGGAAAPDVHLVFTLGEISDVTIDTVGTMFDAVLAVRASCDGSDLACDDDSAGGTHAQLVQEALAPGTYYVVVDGKTGTSGGPWTVNVSIAPAVVQETVVFPSAADTIVPDHGNLWPLGSYVEGARATALTRVTRVDMHLALAANVLTCDTQDMRLLINGTQVGTFSIAGGAVAVDQSFSFAAIAGPSYTLRYETVRQVGSGCGSAAPDRSGTSTVTLHR